MGSRIQLNYELSKFHTNVYFQPPANIKMDYPCIVYRKTDKRNEYGNDKIYLSRQQYSITVIEKDPDSPVADNMERYFTHTAITDYYTADNLHHTILKLFY